MSSTRVCGSALPLSLALALAAATATAQTAPLVSHWESVHVRSGVHDNPTPVEGVVWRGFVFLPQAGTPWLRLYFSKCQLDKGSFLRIVSLLDGDEQRLRMEHVEQWSYSSAFFNGGNVMIEIVAAPGSQKNYVEIDKVLAGDLIADLPAPETICGGTDDRVPSTEPRAGRILGIGCSGWIISTAVTGSPNERLHLTAGHCFGTGQVLQFGVPASSTSCALANPPASLQFAIDDASSISNNGGIGNDYWVFRCFANSNTGLTTFQTQAAAYTLATSMPANGTTLRNVGYGLDGTPVNNGPEASSCGCASPNGARNQTQQTHTGSLVSVVGTRLNHTIDTCGGNSGSVVTVDQSGLAVAIHTNAGCSATGGSNSGTTVLNTGLQAAITTLAAGSGPTAPANDNCSGAVTVVAGTNGPFSSAGATNSSTFPCVASAGRDVWFQHVAGCTGTYTITTCTATRNFDTVLEVFSGTCAAPTSLGCNDDAGGTCGTGSTLTPSLVAGQTYLIRVGGFNAATGAFDLVVTAPCIPANECNIAFVAQLGANGPFSTAGATTSLPAWPCGSAGNDIWLSYAAPAASLVTFSTCNAATTFDTVLQVFAGGCGGLTSLGCNDDDATCSPGTRSRLSVTVAQATTLLVRVGGFQSATGTFQLDVARTPVDDDCAAALTVGNGSNGPFSTVGSTTSQPWGCATAGNDIWFNYSATCTGMLIADTCSQNRTFDTVLEVFAGSCGSLVSLGCNDDAGGACGVGSALAVPVTAGQTYRIRIGGFFGTVGQTDLNLGCAVANDDCTTATPLTLGTNGPFSSVGAGSSAPPFGCGASAGNDVWFRYTATVTAPHTFSTCTATRTFDTALEVLAGPCGSLGPIGCNDDACALGSRVTANLQSGVVYLVRVAGTGGATGSFDVTVETGTGTGTFTTQGGACGALTIAAAGSPNIGGTFTITLGNVQSFAIVGYGFALVPVPFCGCIVGHDWAYMDFGSPQQYTIPLNPAFIGVAVGFQGADLGAAGGCPSPQLTASNTVVLTIG